MSKNLKNLLGLLVWSLIIAIAVFFWGRKSVSPEIIKVPEYHSDTVKVPTPISLDKPKPDKEYLPYVVFKYPPDSIQAYNKLVGINDSLIKVTRILKGRVDTVFITPQFLTQYPKAPKILQLKLNRDSLTLSLLNTNAEIYSSIFPLTLDRFDYTYSGVYNQMSQTSSKTPLKQKFRRSQAFVLATGTYSIDEKLYPAISMPIYYTLNPVVFQLAPQVAIKEKLTVGITGGIGIKLW